MFADINVCEFLILKVFALLKFAILGLPKVKFVFPQNNFPLLILLFGYRSIRWLVLFIHICSLQVTKGTYRVLGDIQGVYPINIIIS